MRIVPQTILDLKWSPLPPTLGQKQILTEISLRSVYHSPWMFLTNYLDSLPVQTHVGNFTTSQNKDLLDWHNNALLDLAQQSSNSYCDESLPAVNHLNY